MCHSSDRFREKQDYEQQNFFIFFSYSNCYYKLSKHDCLDLQPLQCIILSPCSQQQHLFFISVYYLFLLTNHLYNVSHPLLTELICHPGDNDNVLLETEALNFCSGSAIRVIHLTSGLNFLLVNRDKQYLPGGFSGYCVCHRAHTRLCDTCI